MNNDEMNCVYWRNSGKSLKFGSLVLLLLGVFVLCVGLAKPCNAAALNSDDNNFKRPSNSIINEYKNSRQTLVNNYNSLLTDAQKSGKPINVNDFSNNDEISFENSCGNGNISESGKEFCKKLHKRLVNNREMLTDKLKNVNNDMSNNIKIDYDSLKITNNIKDDNEVRPLIQEYVKNYQTEDKYNYLGLFCIIAVPAVALLLATAIENMGTRLKSN